MKYTEKETGSAFNTAVAATASEQIVANTQRVEYFNWLMVQNRDAVDIQIKLNNTTGLGRIFEVQANGGILVLSPEDDIRFTQIVQTNLNAATAQTANKILFRWARLEVV